MSDDDEQRKFNDGLIAGLLLSEATKRPSAESERRYQEAADGIGAIVVGVFWLCKKFWKAKPATKVCVVFTCVVGSICYYLPQYINDHKDDDKIFFRNKYKSEVFKISKAHVAGLSHMLNDDGRATNKLIKLIDEHNKKRSIYEQIREVRGSITTGTKVYLHNCENGSGRFLAHEYMIADLTLARGDTRNLIHSFNEVIAIGRGEGNTMRVVFTDLVNYGMERRGGEEICYADISPSAFIPYARSDMPHLNSSIQTSFRSFLINIGIVPNQNSSIQKPSQPEDGQSAYSAVVPYGDFSRPALNARVTAVSHING